MNTYETEAQARYLRSEAIRSLNKMFGICEGERNGATDRIVDCIIGAAKLEIEVDRRRNLNAVSPTNCLGRAL